MPIRRAQAIPMTVVAFGDIDNVDYQVMNGDGLGAACWEIKIVNDTPEDIYYSFDGVTNHGYVRGRNTDTLEAGVEILRAPAQQGPLAGTVLWQQGQKIWGIYSGSAALAGNIYITGLYN